MLKWGERKKKMKMKRKKKSIIKEKKNCIRKREWRKKVGESFK